MMGVTKESEITTSDNKLVKLKSEVLELNKQITKLENSLAKKEEQGVYSDTEYDTLDKLVEKRDDIQKEIDSIEVA
jgi:chromosome segregation ATPase